MLNRRHLRVKVLQSLYAFFQSAGNDIAAGEKMLLESIEKTYDLYLYQIILLSELANEEEKINEENLRKRLPTYHDLNPSNKFSENLCIQLLTNDQILQKAARRRSISWQNQKELLRKLMLHIRDQDYYKEYMNNDQQNFTSDLEFVVKIFKKSILPYENIHAFYEENNIFWLVDWELVSMMVVRTLKQSELNEGRLVLMDLYKDASDRSFAIELFRLTILNHTEFNNIISAKTRNWDVERIALIDMIIMEMALSEILKFPDIPVKVSLNEYIEISKMYSTPKSNVFINGVLDKLVDDFIEKKIINPNTGGVSKDASG